MKDVILNLAVDSEEKTFTLWYVTYPTIILASVTLLDAIKDWTIIRKMLSIISSFKGGKSKKKGRHYADKDRSEWNNDSDSHSTE